MSREILPRLTISHGQTVQSSIEHLDWVKDTAEIAAMASGSFRLKLSLPARGAGRFGSRAIRDIQHP